MVKTMMTTMKMMMMTVMDRKEAGVTPCSPKMTEAKAGTTNQSPGRMVKKNTQGMNHIEPEEAGFQTTLSRGIAFNKYVCGLCTNVHARQSTGGIDFYATIDW
jgi:hypothetical protein